MILIIKYNMKLNINLFSELSHHAENPPLLQKQQAKKQARCTYLTARTWQYGLAWIHEWTQWVSPTRPIDIGGELDEMCNTLAHTQDVASPKKCPFIPAGNHPSGWPWDRDSSPETLRPQLRRYCVRDRMCSVFEIGLIRSLYLEYVSNEKGTQSFLERFVLI